LTYFKNSFGENLLHRQCPVVVPGDAFLSNMMVLIDGRAGPELKMPHGRKDLTRWEKTVLRRWINRGALND